MALFATAVALCAVELGFRLHARSIPEFEAREAPVRVGDPGKLLAPSPDPVLGYELYRNMDVLFRGARLRTNSHGFRGPEVALRKPAGVYRIVVLGDSVAMGWRIPQGRTYAALLEGKLRGRHTGRKVEVLNFGVQGYNTVQEYRVLRDKALAFDPDLVILGYVGNDLERQENKRGREFLRTPLYSLNFLALKLQAFLGRTDPGLSYDWRYHREREKDQPEDFFEAFKAVGRLSRERGIPVIVVMDSRYVSWGITHTRLAAMAKDLGMEAVDLFKLYRRLPESTPIDRAVSVEDEHNLKYIFERDMGKDNHPNELWHRRTAEVLFERIEARGFLSRRQRGPSASRGGSP